MDQVQQEIKPETNLTQEKVEENQQTTAVTSVETDQDKNWKVFREQREKERKESEAASKRALEKEAEAQALKAALDAVLNKASTQQQQYSNTGFEEEESEDQRIEKKVQVAIAQREAAYEKARMEKEKAEYPEKLRSHFNDFNQVCSSDNLDYLDYHYPEISKAFQHMPDGYDKWAAVYKSVKRFVPNTDTKRDQAKVERNLSKPQSGQSTITDSGTNIIPSQKALEAKRAENYARMQRILKGVG